MLLVTFVSSKTVGDIKYTEPCAAALRVGRAGATLFLKQVY